MGLKPLAHDLFERFPHGVMVFEASGRLVAANKAASKFLGPIRRKPDGHPPRCCDLFGCRTTGVLHGVCLAELAERAEGPLPDMRADLPADAPADSAWLTVAPFNGKGKHFLVELRTADSFDRRRRTQPHWMGDRQLRIFALGRTRLESREGPIEGRWLEQRAGQLLKYLVCERRRVVYPEEIAAAIWPHEAHETGTMRYFIHRLRRHLEPQPPDHGPSSFVIAVDGGYRLAPSVEVDADEFEHHVNAGIEARSEGESAAAEQHLERAVTLYAGDLMVDRPNDPWVFEERERLRNLADRALRHLVQGDLARRDADSALERLRRLVKLQPFDLDLHRQLLTLCLACGRRSEAMRRYSILKATLRNGFNEELGFELADLTPDDAARAFEVIAIATAPEVSAGL